MATKATTATESLQCMACAIRQNAGGTITKDDIFDLLEGNKSNIDYKQIKSLISVPSDSFNFVKNWVRTQGSYEALLDEEFANIEGREDLSMEDNLFLRAKKGSDLDMWVNSVVWIANELMKDSKGLDKSKIYKFFHADETIGSSGINFKGLAMDLIKEIKKNAIDPKFKTAISIVAKGTGDKWNPADMFAIEKSQIPSVARKLKEIKDGTSTYLPEKSQELEDLAKTLKGHAHKNIELTTEVGKLYAYNELINDLYDSRVCVPISLKKATSQNVGVTLYQHTKSSGADAALNLEVEIEKVDYKPTADKAIVYFKIGNKSGANLDFRGFEPSATIGDVQAQIQAAGSGASHGKIALPLYSFIVEESKGERAIKAQKLMKDRIFGKGVIEDSSEHVFTDPKIFNQYANNKWRKGTKERFNQRTLVHDSIKWAQYIHWLSKGSGGVPTETVVQRGDVVRNVKQRLGDPKGSMIPGSDVSLLPTKKIGGVTTPVWGHKRKTGAIPWPKTKSGASFRKMTPDDVYKGKPQDYIWAAKYIKNKVQSAEAVFIVDIARRVPTKKIKENILKSAYSYAASKGLRIFNDSAVKEFMSASTYIKVGG